MMDYTEFIADWDSDDLPQRAALDARICDMLTQHLDEDQLWPATVCGLADDLVERDEVRKMLIRVNIVVGHLLIWNHGGRAQAVAALNQQLEQLRTIAMGGQTE